MQKHPKVRADKIGVWGISQAGYVIPRAIQKTDESFYDPIKVIEKTKIPMLVFFGDLDKNVNPFQGMKAFQAALEKAKNPNFKVVLIKGADHNIIISETGCMSERNARSGKGWSNYNLKYLSTMEMWLKNQEK